MRAYCALRSGDQATLNGIWGYVNQVYGPGRWPRQLGFIHQELQPKQGVASEAEIQAEAISFTEPWVDPFADTEEELPGRTEEEAFWDRFYAQRESQQGENYPDDEIRLDVRDGNPEEPDWEEMEAWGSRYCQEEVDPEEADLENDFEPDEFP